MAWCATVPINDAGINDYEMMLEESENFLSFWIPNEERNALFKDGVFRKINMACDIAIDEYEDEIIPANEVDNAIEQVDKSRYPIFYAALLKAKEYNQLVALDV